MEQYCQISVLNKCFSELLLCILQQQSNALYVI